MRHASEVFATPKPLEVLERDLREDMHSGRKIGMSHSVPSERILAPSKVSLSLTGSGPGSLQLISANVSFWSEMARGEQSTFRFAEDGQWESRRKPRVSLILTGSAGMAAYAVVVV